MGGDHRQSNFVWVALFLAPGLALYGTFIVYAMLTSFGYSLFNWSGLGDLGAFLGSKNYEFVLWAGGEVSVIFWHAVANNILYFIATLVLTSVGGLLISYCLTLISDRTSNLFKTIFFLPMVIPPIVVGYLWGIYLDPNSGAIAVGLHSLGLDGLMLPLLGLKATALPTVAAITVWSHLGIYIFILTPAINNVPSETIEAARVDGAGALRTFALIIFPQILPIYLTVVTLLFIGSFGIFDLVFILEGPGGGPDFATDTLATLFFRSAFGSAQGGATASMSMAAAMAILGFILIMGVSAVLIVLQRRVARFY